MNKFIFILLLTITPIMAQEKNKTLTVIGETNKQVKINSYSITISLKQVLADGYQQLEPKSVVELQRIYSDKLKTIGVDFSKFNENILYQLYYSPSEMSDIVYYDYVSNSEEEIMKIIKQKMHGLTILQAQPDAKNLTTKEGTNLTLMAIEDAKTKAQKIAEGLGKKLGSIIKVKDSNTKAQTVSTYKLDEIQKHYVTVTFTIE